jgi:ABC-2 type transport system permease protein
MVARPGGDIVIAARTFLAFFGTSFRKHLVYRSDVWLSILFGLVAIVIQAAIWRALLGDGAVDGITVDDMVTYVIITTVISTVSLHRLVNDVDERLRGGDIAIDLVKPMHYPSLQLADQLGRSALQMAFVVVPMVAISVLAFDVEAPAGTMAGVGFAASLAIALLVSFTQGLLLALLAFWFLTTFHFVWANGALVTLFGGATLPLWFFPDALETVARLLPYQFVAFVPASIWLGETAGGEMALTLALGAVWIAIQGAACQVLWSAAVRRLTVQGG